MIFFSALAAFLPTLFLVWLIWWADRYEREPAALLIAAFVWGAIPAILLALVAEIVAGVPFDGEGLGNALAQSALIAPIVEELVKGAALLGLLRFARAEIDDILDGIVYGALIGAGFAMTENFLYFLSSASLGQWTMTVILRALVFGLNHSFYTAIFGAAVGMAAPRSDVSTRKLLMAMGLALAMMAHAFHNLIITLTQALPLLFLAGVLMDWGGALVMLAIVLIALGRERNAIRAYLDALQARGLSPDDRRRLLALLPPRERLLPNFPWLGPERQRRNRLYQSVAELALRQQRLQRSPSAAKRTQLQQEITELQARIDTLTATENADVVGERRPD